MEVQRVEGCDNCTQCHGRYYFICGIGGHCAGGQKVTVTVTEAPILVGGDNGWNLGVNYAAGIDATVGDTVRFVYTEGAHNVEQVADATAYGACTKTGTNLGTAGTYDFTPDAAGTFVHSIRCSDLRCVRTYDPRTRMGT